MDSFKKGELFESFILQKVFTQDHFTLVHRTNSYEQNQERYSENTTKPDFKFRCKASGKEFYVEAKYRSKAFMNKVKILNGNQILRFKSLEQEEQIPIFLIVGYQGHPANPDSISVFPFNELKYEELSTYELGKLMCPINDIPNRITSYLSPTPVNVEPNAVSSSKPIKAKKNRLAIYAMALVAILCTVLGIWAFSKSHSMPIFKEVQTMVDHYNRLTLSGDQASLEKVLAPTLETWYTRHNISRSDVIDDILRYNKKYPNRDQRINWQTLHFKKLSNGNIELSYEVDYHIHPKGKNRPSKTRRKVTSIWSPQNQLLSISDEVLR